jgi:6-phosphofructokinase
MSSSIPFGVIDKVEILQVHTATLLLKVMGRDAGHIALNAGVVLTVPGKSLYLKKFRFRSSVRIFEKK